MSVGANQAFAAQLVRPRPAVALGTAMKRGSTWAAGGFAATQVIRFGSSMVMTRLLFPEAFGLMALVNTFLAGLEMFSDIGVGPSIVQHAKGDEQRFRQTAWTIQIIRGLILWTIAIVLALPMAAFYGQPLLAGMLPVAALSVVLASTASTKLWVAQRELKLGTLTLIDVGCALASMAAMVSMAIVWRSPWALVAGALVSPTLKSLLSHLVLQGSCDGLGWDREARQAIIQFGRWIMLNTAIGFLAMQGDRLILGKLLTTESLGVYGIAITLVMMPAGLFGRLGDQILFPALSRCARETPTEFASNLRRARRPLLLIGLLALPLMIAAGDLLVRSCYDVRYYAAGWMVCLMATGLWAQVLGGTTDWALLALGKPRYLTLGNAIRVLGLLVGTIYMARYGVVGVVSVAAAAAWLRLIGIWIGAYCERLRVVRQDISYTCAAAVLTILFLSLRWSVGLGLPWQ